MDGEDRAAGAGPTLVDSDSDEETGTWYVPNPEYVPGFDNGEVPRHIPASGPQRRFYRTAVKCMREGKEPTFEAPKRENRDDPPEEAIM